MWGVLFGLCFGDSVCIRVLVAFFFFFSFKQEEGIILHFDFPESDCFIIVFYHSISSTFERWR